jgi:hypothetical protein
VGLFDKTKLTAWLEPTGCLALEATGVVETLVEVGEVFAFITAALRSGPGESVASIIPTIHSGAKTKDQKYRFTVRAQLPMVPCGLMANAGKTCSETLSSFSAFP